MGKLNINLVKVYMTIWKFTILHGNASTISTGQFSIANCLLTKGYYIKLEPVKSGILHFANEIVDGCRKLQGLVSGKGGEKSCPFYSQFAEHSVLTQKTWRA